MEGYESACLLFFYTIPFSELRNLTYFLAVLSSTFRVVQFDSILMSFVNSFVFRVFLQNFRKFCKVTRLHKTIYFDLPGYDDVSAILIVLWRVLSTTNIGLSGENRVQPVDGDGRHLNKLWSNCVQ